MKPCSLYIIAKILDGVKSSPIKIGIARDPVRRLADFQTACPDELAISLNVVVWSREMASDWERACIAIAKAIGIHRRGEWINLDPDNVGGLLGCGIDIACNNAALRDWRLYDSEVAKQANLWKRLEAIS